MLKALEVEGRLWLVRLFYVVLRSGTEPKEWQTGVVVPLFQRGDQRVCANSRGITLLSLSGKVYSKVLEKMVRLIVEPQIEAEACGFRPGRGTTDQLFTLARILEGAWELASPVHMCCVDLEKAHDRVPPPGDLVGGVAGVWGEGGSVKGQPISALSKRELCQGPRQ